MRRDAIERSSRLLWRALTPSLMPDPRRPGWSEEYLLDVCRAGVSRVAADPRSQPMASRSLFAAARSLMTPHDQLRVSLIIDAHLARARSRFEAERGPAPADGGLPRCAAVNRRGKPCGREPIWGTAFCVSHTVRPSVAA